MSLLTRAAVAIFLAGAVFGLGLFALVAYGFL